jgi:penicillin-binding protein 2
VSDLVLGKTPPPRNRLTVRFAVFGLIVVVVVGVLSTRLVYLQIAQGGYFSGLAQSNTAVLQPLKSARGVIYDRTGRVVAANVATYVVTVRPADLPFAQRPAVVARLAELVHVPADEIIQALDRNAGRRFDPVRVAADVPIDVARIIAEESHTLPGVEVTVELRREYAYGPLLAHVLGYTGRVSADDLKTLAAEGYLTDDVRGRAGVEAVYEQALRGTYGSEQVEIGPTGATLRTLQVVQEPRTGDSLELSIDVDTQEQAQTALDWATGIVGLKRGVVIVMNPQTGEILAMVSNPTYDDNLFARGISNEDFQALLTNPDRPLINYAISEQFPPGSTYKLVTASGALAEGVITDKTQLETYPYLELGNNRYYDWNRHGFGPLDIYGGFAYSSDTFFYQVAAMLGIDRLAQYADDFGFGQRTGIDLPAEARGIVPTDEWKQEVFNQPIYPGEVYHAGIGQGYDAVTPLQILNAYSALANGGKLYQPQVVRRIIGPDGSVVRDFQPELVRTLDTDPKVLETMRIAARQVITSRHTANFVDLPIVVAGKTGLAEFGTRDSQGRMPFHSWFVAFVPKFEPDQPGDVTKTDSELAVVAFAYAADTKGNAATEMVKYFLQLHYHLDIDLRQPELLRNGNFFGGT